MAPFEKPGGSLEQQLDTLKIKAVQEIEKAGNPKNFESPADTLDAHLKVHSRYLQTPSSPQESEEEKQSKRDIVINLLRSWGIEKNTAEEILSILERIKIGGGAIH